MKILIVAFTFPPNKDGVSDAAAAMTRGFTARGWEVDVLTEITTPARESMLWNNARIHEYTHTGGNSPDIILREQGTSYADFLLAGSWDVLIFHAYGPHLQLALPVMERIRGKKFLVSHGYAALMWVRTNRFPFGLVYWMKSVIASFRMPAWLGRFDRTIYLSEQSDLFGFYDHFIAKACSYAGARVIPNGVDLAERGANPEGFRQQHGIPRDAFLFVCVANYSRRKDQGYGARAFRKAAIPGSVLVFIGSDFNIYSQAFQAADEQQRGSNPPGTIIWLEKQSRSSTLDALAACDAFVLSANHEAQPIALLEAMREGKPWIARKAGCIERMEGGLCVTSEQAMADAMVRLSSDGALRDRLSREGAEAVSLRYDRNTYMDSYCKLVEELAPDAV